MIQLNLDDIEAVLDRANDDADRVSVYEYREALNAVYHAAMRILSQKMAVERERDELKTRLAHAEADAEQAIHNEAFNERQRIVDWIRSKHLVLSSLAIANCIEQGEHEG